MRPAPQQCATRAALVQIKYLLRAARSGASLPIAEILHSAGRSGLGYVVLALALPALTPVPGPLGMVFGTALAIAAVQIIAGRQTIGLPNILRHRRVAPSILRALAKLILRISRGASSFARQGRLAQFMGTSTEVIAGCAVLASAILIVLPVPFGNILPVASVALIAIALIWRDGLLMLFGSAFCGLTCLGTTVAALLIWDMVSA